uniref:Uncharacterized protein n=1 Tax=Rhizophora mucronata TaxID=61149 RepID=A0A2P2P290_RHIMU
MNNEKLGHCGGPNENLTSINTEAVVDWFGLKTPQDNGTEASQMPIDKFILEYPTPFDCLKKETLYPT